MNAVILLVVLIFLHNSAKTSAITTNNKLITRSKVTSSLKPTTTTDIFYDYSLVSNLTVISPANLTSDSRLLSSTKSTLQLAIDPEAQLNETITNIKTYIPEIQNEIS
jgi:uncharacterized paraquat-inducible protein A